MGLQSSFVVYGKIINLYYRIFCTIPFFPVFTV